MQAHQLKHINSVVALAGEGRWLSPHAGPDLIIRDSWTRCVREHRLDPSRMQEAIIVPQTELREHQDSIEEFLSIARHGLETLYQTVAGLGYCVLLTDSRGITVDFIGDLILDHSLHKAGLYLGADWSEKSAGTCGVGTCIATGEALTVHLDDHFNAAHIPLTCTTAPIFDSKGRLNAVLDISQLSSSEQKQSQHLALQLVKVFAHRIENASFLHVHRNNCILRLSPTPQFLDVAPEYLVALDAGGRVIGHNRRAQLMLQDQVLRPVIGMQFERLFNTSLGDLGRFTMQRPSDQRAITLAHSERVLFMNAAEPHECRTVQPRLIKRNIPLPLADLSGGDAAMDRQIDRVARFAHSTVSVLLTGETGTGKECLAKALHASGARKNRPFVAVNCGAIPESLIESELFGHLPGSFSGAGTKAKRGLVQEADGGTLFLDEIGDMPRDLQARLLRVLAEREVLPIGATKPLPVDIRVISATHCDLEAMIRSGSFREDLYYRLNGATIRLPPLRERSDFDWLIRRMFTTQATGSAAKTTDPQLSTPAHAWLQSYHWPGNLRELRNVIEFALAVCNDGIIEIHDLPDYLTRGQSQKMGHAVGSGSTDAGIAHAASAEALLLLQYLRAGQWNVTAVARQLGIARMTLYRRMERFGIESPNRRGDHSH